jgi:spermidine/putrescine transport system ATP-binding protein
VSETEGRAESAISLTDVRKSFGKVQAVRGISLDVSEGEFLTLLGPSGCGKTTTMRLIAGFEDLDHGVILLRGKDVAGVPPNRREVNMVFQDYALFPHMSVAANVAYGLKLRKVPKEERLRRVGEMLEIVRLPGYEKRKPRQLSGGQQQRVALARALVNHPAALLLDEPLGALDVKLRKQMQLELKRIQNEMGTTFVYVTHDQEEALSMSDRIAVMSDGLIEQVGTPREVYDRPQTSFVADFLGVLNAIDFRADEVDGRQAIMRVGDRDRIVVSVEEGVAVGSSLMIAVRPERVRLEQEDVVGPSGVSRISGAITQIVYLGTLTQFHVKTALSRSIIAHQLSNEETARLREEDHVMLTWTPEDASILREE